VPALLSQGGKTRAITFVVPRYSAIEVLKRLVKRSGP
jgi:hypothetical protein